MNRYQKAPVLIVCLLLQCRSLQRNASHSKSSMEVMAQDLIPGNVADFNSEERQPVSSSQITQRQELSFLSDSFRDASSVAPLDSMVSPTSAPRAPSLIDPVLPRKRAQESVLRDAPHFKCPFRTSCVLNFELCSSKCPSLLLPRLRMLSRALCNLAQVISPRLR